MREAGIVTLIRMRKLGFKRWRNLPKSRSNWFVMLFWDSFWLQIIAYFCKLDKSRERERRKVVAGEPRVVLTSGKAESWNCCF